jgi:hypothetical protein
VFPDIFGFDEVQPERRHGIRGSHLDRRCEPARWLAASDPIDLIEQWQLVPRETDDE